MRYCATKKVVVARDSCYNSLYLLNVNLDAGCVIFV